MVEGFWAINLGDILQTLGGVAGAFLAVRMSVKISNKQISHEKDILDKQISYSKEQEKIKEAEKFLKVYHSIESAINISLAAAEKIMIHIEEAKISFVGGPVTHAHDSINQTVENFHYASDLLKDINEEYIPLNVHKEFLVIKNLVSFYYPIIKLQLDIHSNPAHFYLEEIIGTGSALQEFSKKIESYKILQEELLKK